MEYRRLGRSGLQLSVLSFGSWVSFSKQINDKVADELMGIAYDNGVNFFDNAEIYTNQWMYKYWALLNQNVSF